jgi:hypothetical protein
MNDPGELPAPLWPRRMKTRRVPLYGGLAYALEARDFKNFQGMVNKALVLENHRGVAPSPELLCPQLDLCSILLSHSFSQGHRPLDKDSLPHCVK